MASDSSSSLSRRERERQMRRRAMLDAAQAVFAEKGYARATLDEIADQAEFGKGTLYNYFEGGKEGLLFAIFDEVYDDLHTMIRETVGTATDRTLRDAFHTLVRRSFQYYEEREELFLILIKEAHRLCFSDDADKAAYFQNQQRRMIKAFVPAVEAAAEAGDIVALPPRSVAHLLLEVINDMVVHRCLDERQQAVTGPVPDADLVHAPEAAADFLTTMLFDGLGDDGPTPPGPTT